MTTAQVAYLAGVIDGDGWITLQGPTSRLCIGTQQTDGDAEVMLGSIYEFAGGAVYPCSGRLAWQATGLAAIPIIRRVEPYLILKRARARAVLDFYESDRAACARVFARAAQPARVDRYLGAVRAASLVEKAYAAGFFDCEGMVGISLGRTKKLSGTGRPKCMPISLNVYLSQVAPAPLVWIADRWGANVYCRKHNGPVVGFVHASQLCGHKAIKFLSDVAPYVRLKRREVQRVLADWTFAQPGEDYAKLRERRLRLKVALEEIRRVWKGAGGRATLRMAR